MADVRIVRTGYAKWNYAPVFFYFEFYSRRQTKSHQAKIDSPYVKAITLGTKLMLTYRYRFRTMARQTKIPKPKPVRYARVAVPPVQRWDAKANRELADDMYYGGGT